MMRLIIDTSALIDALRVPALAERLNASFDVCAPALIQWETGNVIHGDPDVFGDLKRRNRVVATLLAPVRLIDQSERLDDVGRLAMKHNLTFYDAAYLAAAEDDDGMLLTQDKKLLKAARRALGDARAVNLRDAEAAWAADGL